VPSGGRAHPGDGNDSDDGDGEEDTQGEENGTGKRNRTNIRREKENVTEIAKGKCTVKHTPAGDDISRAVAMQLQRELYGADSHIVKQQGRVFFELKVSPAMSISQDDGEDDEEELDEDKEEEVVVDEDNGKEPQMIGYGENLNT
jgi:hypothetical protein